MKFNFKKQMNGAGKKLGCGVIRAGGGVGGMWLAKKVTTPNAEGKAMLGEKMRPFVGPAMMAVGLLGEIFIPNEYLRSAAEGLTVAGGIVTAGDHIFKDDKSQIGLAGVGATDTAPIPADVANIDFDALLREADDIVDQETEVPGGPTIEGAEEYEEYQEPTPAPAF